jgi:5-methylcytosine-specific restriction endonuclease McrA
MALAIGQGRRPGPPGAREGCGRPGRRSAGGWRPGPLRESRFLSDLPNHRLPKPLPFPSCKIDRVPSSPPRRHWAPTTFMGPIWPRFCKGTQSDFTLQRRTGSTDNSLEVLRMVCSVCGNERPDRGTCKSCGSKLCCVCRVPLSLERKDTRCLDCDRERIKAWKQKNQERVKGYGRGYRKANRAILNERNRRWSESNPEKDRLIHKKWRSANKDKKRAENHRRRARKLGCSISPADLTEVVERSGGLCGLCRSYVPEGLRHIDHVVPLSAGGQHCQDNLQLLCALCNLRKGTRRPEDVVPKKWLKSDPPLQPFLLNPDWR